MRVVNIVIGVGWVIFWVGWFAAVRRGQAGTAGTGQLGALRGRPAGADPGRRAPGPAAGAEGAWRRIRQRPGPVGCRPRHLGPSAGLDADVHEGRPEWPIRPAPDDRHPGYTGTAGDDRLATTQMLDRRGTFTCLRGGATPGAGACWRDGPRPRCWSRGRALAPARCLNRIPVRVRRSAAGRAVQRSGRRPGSAVSAGPSGASRVGVSGMEEEFRLGKDSFGLDESQVRLYTAIARTPCWSWPPWPSAPSARGGYTARRLPPRRSLSSRHFRAGL